MSETVMERLFKIYNKNVQESVIEIDESKVEQLDIMKSNLIDIGFNSFLFIRLIVEIENEFDIEFDDEKLNIGAFLTINDLCDYIKSKVC